MSNFQRFFIISIVLLSSQLYAQTIKNEVIAVEDSWFWDFKKDGIDCKPVQFKNKVYMLYKETGLLETDGTQAGTRVLDCMANKGLILNFVASDNYLYFLMKDADPGNKLYKIYRLYRVSPDKNEAVPVLNAYGKTTLEFADAKDYPLPPFYRLRTHGDRISVLFFDNFLYRIITVHDADETPMAHTIASGTKGTDRTPSFKNYYEQYVLGKHNTFLYNKSNGIKAYVFDTLSGFGKEKYYQSGIEFNFPEKELELLHMLAVNQNELYVLLAEKATTAKSKLVYKIDGTNAKLAAILDKEVDELIQLNGELYAKSNSRLYKVNTQNGVIETIIDQSRKFGYLDIYKNYFKIVDNRLYYCLHTEFYSDLIAQYFAIDLATKKEIVVWDTKLGTNDKDIVSSKYLLNQLGNHVISITREKAFYGAKLYNPFDKTYTELPLPRYMGTTLSKDEPEIYGNMVQVGKKIFYWGGYFNIKRKVGKKKKTVNERVMGCLSVE